MELSRFHVTLSTRLENSLPVNRDGMSHVIRMVAMDFGQMYIFYDGGLV